MGFNDRVLTRYDRYAFLDMWGSIYGSWSMAIYITEILYLACEGYMISCLSVSGYNLQTSYYVVGFGLLMFRKQLLHKQFSN